MDILDDMGASKLSAKVFFFKVNYCFNLKGVLEGVEMWVLIYADLNNKKIDLYVLCESDVNVAVADSNRPTKKV